MVRLAHISDIHVTARPLGMCLGDWWTKRCAAWLNVHVGGRGSRFRNAERVLDVWRTEAPGRRFDRIIFSGDATTMGFPRELERAARMLGVSESQSGLATPGNHDYCTRPAEGSGEFERTFAPWLAGERIDGHTYPFAQKVGDAWIVSVNSARGNFWFWDASGRIADDQLDRLRRLLKALSPGPRILVTHYPICLANGKSESYAHGLRNCEKAIGIAAEGGVKLWLHGHRHDFYWFAKPTQAPFAVICAGSGTQNKLWSYLEYDLNGSSLAARRRVFDERSNAFRDAESFTLSLE